MKERINPRDVSTEEHRLEGSPHMLGKLVLSVAAAALAGCAANPYTYETTRAPVAYDTSTTYVVVPAAPATACPTTVTSNGYMVYRC
jgi:hypothetical protein